MAFITAIFIFFDNSDVDFNDGGNNDNLVSLACLRVACCSLQRKASRC